MSHSRLIITALFISSLLVACGDSDAPKTTNNAASSSATTTSTVQIKTGMSIQAVTDLLGEPNISQTRKIDDLTIVHNEWVDSSGTLSVQFQNGKAQYHQFIPPAQEN